MRGFFNKLAVGNEVRVEYEEAGRDKWRFVFTHDDTPTVLRFRCTGFSEEDLDDAEHAVNALNEALSISGRRLTLERIEADCRDVQELHRPSFDTLRQVCRKQSDWPGINGYVFRYEETA